MSHQPELAIEDIDVDDGAVVSVVEDIDLDDPPSLPPQPQPPAPAPAAPAPTGGLVGRAVLLNGLVARADLNGATGFVLSYDTARGRYVIRVVSSGELVNVRPANVSLLVAPSGDLTEYDPRKAPRRAQTAWNYYTSKARRVLKRERPQATEEELQALLKASWEQLPAAERSVYEGKAAADRERHASQLALHASLHASHRSASDLTFGGQLPPLPAAAPSPLGDLTFGGQLPPLPAAAPPLAAGAVHLQMQVAQQLAAGRACISQLHGAGFATPALASLPGPSAASCAAPVGSQQLRDLMGGAPCGGGQQLRDVMGAGGASLPPPPALPPLLVNGFVGGGWGGAATAAAPPTLPPPPPLSKQEAAQLRAREREAREMAARATKLAVQQQRQQAKEAERLLREQAAPEGEGASGGAAPPSDGSVASGS